MSTSTTITTAGAGREEADFTITTAIDTGSAVWCLHAPGEDGVANATALYRAGDEGMRIEFAAVRGSLRHRTEHDVWWQPMGAEEVAIVIGTNLDALRGLRDRWPGAALELTGAIHRTLEVAAGGDLERAVTEHAIYSTATVETAGGERFVVHGIERSPVFGGGETTSHGGREIPLSELVLVDEAREPGTY